jgi:hypothetical protein
LIAAQLSQDEVNEHDAVACGATFPPPLSLPTVSWKVRVTGALRLS